MSTTCCWHSTSSLIIIFTDSLSSILILNNNFLKRNERLLVKVYLYERKIIIQWILSHVGIIGNELVDMLAKEVKELEEITELDFVFEKYISMIKEKKE